MKSAQMGISERSVSEAAWICDQLNCNVLYTFPTQTHLQDFVQARIDPVLALSEYLRSRSDAADDTEKKIMKIGLKRIGRGFLYLRGSQNEKQIITIDADCVFMDERDRFSQDNVPYIEKRLLASNLKWIREISTPTYPGKGIHASFLASDQKVWEIQCEECKLWQELDFFINVDFEKKITFCKACKAPIDRYKDGRWTKQNPTSEISGYKINGIYNPSASIADMIKKYGEAQMGGFSALQQFFNQDLGLPYESAGQKLSNNDIESAKGDFFFPVKTKNNCYAGCDVGNLLNVVVLQKISEDLTKMVWAGTVKDFFGPYSSLEQIMTRYDIKTLVIDKNPEKTKVKEFIEKFPGKVFAATYPNTTFNIKEYYIFDDITYEVKLDRTISLDYTISDIQNQRIEFPRNLDSIEGFTDQLLSSVRITEKNPKTGLEVSRWIEKGADHFLHTLNYARIAQIRGTIGKALMDYYVKPEKTISPNLVHWIKLNGIRLS